jgi:uncharacterized membrane protein
LFLKQKKLPTTFFWLVLLLPLFGVISSYYGNRQSLLAVFLIAALTVFSVIGGPEEPTGKTYDHHVMRLILSLSLTLLMSQVVASSYLQGGDIHQEYNVFSQVLAGGFWHPSISATYNDVLSVTVFPAVLKIVSGLDGTVIFTIVFPLMFSITPVLLYKLCRRFLAPTESFFAAFLFLAYNSFYNGLIALARQEIAEILLLLLLLLLMSPKLARTRARSVSILVLTVGVVAAHYTIAYIYLFLLVVWYLMGLAFPRTRVVTSEEMGLTASLTLIWFAILFSTGSGTIADLVRFIWGANLTGFFSPASRPSVVNQALGIGGLSTPLHLLNRATYYLVNAALGLGFLAALFKRKKNDAERKILPVLAFGVLFIGASVVLPSFAFGLNLPRDYHIGLLLASPCFVYGIIFLTSIIRRLFSALTHLPLRVPATRSITNWRLSAATLLFLFLLFDSGWVWAVSLDNPTSLLLDSERILHSPDGAANYYGQYISPEDVAAARWLSPQFGVVRSLCADYWTRDNVLTSYGGLSRDTSSIRTYFLPECDFRGGAYVFLSVLNTVYGIGIGFGAGVGTQSSVIPMWPISQISSELMSDNMIYSNGGTTIYTYPG